MATQSEPHRVVVVGGGFGGLRVVKALRGQDVQVTLIDRRNFHLFQPLTYQVATGALSPSDVTYPLRALFGSAPNVTVLLAAVIDFDLEQRRVRLAPDRVPGAPESVPYDTLVVATGSSYSYFGHDDWRRYAGEVKSLESAVAVRSRVLEALERAEASTEVADRRAELTFVVVGGGPTGVEIAGQIGELTRDTMTRDFRRISGEDTRILLVEMTDRVLGGFPPGLSARAQRSLQRLGVTPTLGREVVAIDGDGVTLKGPGGDAERIVTRTVIWAAGVRASGLAARLGELSGAEVDRSGRVTVGPDLSLPGHPEVIALGDMVRVGDGQGGVQDLPGVAPVAIQQGVYAAKAVRRRLAGQPVKPFHYVNKGNLATIGRGRAVADLGFLRLSGLPAWLIWLAVHIWYLIGYQNRLVVMFRWSFSFLSRGRTQGSRIISDPEDAAAAQINPSG
ncbi:MAG TPA: NAD(P)/FAD-dependent oxidoreductase [Solirubrobacteraceae bacterium]|nr:NAD(P)/FAD-dependent oxidoreductase [Solirubrobacteraceae bacterium]